MKKADLAATQRDISPVMGSCLQIAAVSIAISPDPQIRLLAPDPLYQKFYGDEKSISRLQARLVLGKMPDLSRVQKTFDTRESWSLFSDAHGGWIRFQSDTQPDPYWTARFDRQANRAIVYCGSPLRVATGKKKNSFANPICYPLDQLLLMYHLAYRDGVLVHAAAIEQNGQGFIFPGSSGAGKSTITRLFAATGTGNLLSDERVALRLTGADWQVYGTPWAGTAGIGGNCRAPLAGIFFLEHGASNRFRKIAAAKALERLLPVLSIPWYDPEVMARVIAHAQRLTAKVPAYEMSFTPDQSAVDAFARFLN